ncbi:hypothetical protein [Bradyrhizobium sp. G127]|jgi:hypothetical protein|uniref:hypothetical protein n=1 Tax=Bradyrhizobium sp. G127 TaxID=2904800 RepID=UPI001F3206DC|nr:hypothetical protein [Bradyrhizobium sp. G127]MCF2523981.1 hypothetical protein [Bradyrhizobium sp. G127]
MAARESRSDFLQAHDAATDGGPIEAASFISGAVAELSQLAKRHRLDLLGYLLDMAKLEADEITRREPTPGKF